MRLWVYHLSELNSKLGFVSLVGAGPGDPDLITVKGLRLLTKADVVAYDRLVNTELLLECPLKAQRIFVGKSSDFEQEDINKLLIDKAREGLRVVRLKGGDPFVFGRGGEEALALQEAGVPFEVVPGISSAMAVPAYAGIPVTHRHISTSFTVVTGHEDPNKPTSTLNWPMLAKSETLVVLMGLSNLKHISLKLIENGCLPETPAAVIYCGTMVEQKTVLGTLINIYQRVVEVALEPPAILLVGEVATLHEKLQWFKTSNLKLGVSDTGNSR